MVLGSFRHHHALALHQKERALCGTVTEDKTQMWSVAQGVEHLSEGQQRGTRMLASILRRRSYRATRRSAARLRQPRMQGATSGAIVKGQYAGLRTCEMHFLKMKRVSEDPWALPDSGVNNGFLRYRVVILSTLSGRVDWWISPPTLSQVIRGKGALQRDIFLVFQFLKQRWVHCCPA